MSFLLALLSLFPAQDLDKILERADKILDEAKAAYEQARVRSSVPLFIDAGFKLEEARIKYLVLQEIGTPEKQKIAADRLRAVNQLSKLVHDGKVAVGGVPAEPAAPKPADPAPAAEPPPPPKAPVDVSKRAPVPDPAKQREPEKIIRDLYKEQYAKKAPADRRALARLLLTQAIKSNDDLASQWVLYREAQDVAVQGADARLAMEAIDAAARLFDIDVMALKTQALASIGRVVKAPEELTGLASAHLLLADELIQVDQYEAAEKSAQAAAQLARKGADAALALRAAARAKDAAEARSQFQNLKKSLETLAKTPDDGPANADMGRFLCFVKGSWDLGLRFLSKGSDEPLKALSEKELALPTASADRLALADGWYDLSEKEKSLLKKLQLQRHARGLYESALPDATTLARARIEKRLEAIDYFAAAPSAPGGPAAIDITSLAPKSGLPDGTNTNNVNSRVFTGGKECRKYLYAHAPSALTYEIPPGSRLFAATGVKLDRSNPAVAGTWKYIVSVDGKVAYESKPLNEMKDFEVEISVPIPPGSKEILLRIDPLADNKADWAVWAYPRFQR